MRVVRHRRRSRSRHPQPDRLLVKPGDAAGLARAISELLSDPDLRRRMGEAGRRRVDPAFRAETMVEQIAAEYITLIRRHPERLAKFNQRHARELAKAIEETPS